MILIEQVFVLGEDSGMEEFRDSGILRIEY